jgi:hypothetical protein
MNPAVFPGSAPPDHLPLYTHSKHVTRSSLGETATPRPRSLVVNLPLDGE